MTSTSPSEPLERVQIHRLSFTAFRLIYAPSDEVNHLAKSIFIGRIPDPWFSSESTSSIFGIIKRLRTAVTSLVRDQSATIEKSVRFYATGPAQQPETAENIDAEGNMEDTKLLGKYARLNKKLASAFRDAYLSYCGAGSEDEFEESDTQSSLDGDESVDNGEVLIVVDSPDSGSAISSTNEIWTMPTRNMLANTRTPILGDSVGMSRSGSELDDSISSSQYEDARSSDGAQEDSSIMKDGYFILPEHKTDKQELQAFDAEAEILSSHSRSSPCGSPRSSLDPGGERLDDPTDESKESASIVTPRIFKPLRAPEPSGFVVRKFTSSLETVAAPGEERLPAGPESALRVLSPSKEFKQVTFEPQVLLNSRKSRIDFATPAPEPETVQDQLNDEYITAEKRHMRAMKKILVLASSSKQSAKHRGTRIWAHVDNLLGRFQPSEIVYVDKMEVMMAKTSRRCNLKEYSDYNLTDFRIVQRWHEQYMVIRRTNSVTEPVEIQFYEVHDKQDFEEKPEQVIGLHLQTRAEFLSTLDKTIILWDASGIETRVFFVNARYSSTAYKWLFMIHQLNGRLHAPTINATIVGADLTVNARLPLAEFYDEMPEELELEVFESGYRPIQNAAFESLRQNFTQRLQSLRNFKEVLRLLENPRNMGFAFKFYDRLEWAPDHPVTFMLATQLLRKRAVLELRRTSRTKTRLSLPSGKVIERPVPIEGFLGRITNTAGEQYSNLRAFYRIQYFFVEGPLLFFSQMFKAVPPSPENEFNKDNTDKLAVALQLPEVYLKDPFNIDSSGHIPWIGTPDFDKFDSLALEEFERRIYQIFKSDALVDLTLVREVRAIPYEDIPAHHLYFQSFIWYLSPKTIEDEAIMDSGFELILANGSRVQLLAPTRSARDEWVKRIAEIVMYWREHAKYDSLTSLEVRKHNLHHLKIDEFVDSNGEVEPGGLEARQAIPNENLFSISALAMDTSILKLGYLFLKHRKHGNFVQYFVILCPGYVKIYSLFQRSKLTLRWKRTPYFEHYMSVPLAECYIHSGALTEHDLIDRRDTTAPGENQLPRLYDDGWRSSEEDTKRCFVLRFADQQTVKGAPMGSKNPGRIHTWRKLGFSGKRLVFLARSRLEKESWVLRLLIEANRLTGTHG